MRRFIARNSERIGYGGERRSAHADQRASNEPVGTTRLRAGQQAVAGLAAGAAKALCSWRRRGWRALGGLAWPAPASWRPGLRPPLLACGARGHAWAPSAGAAAVRVAARCLRLGRQFGRGAGAGGGCRRRGVVPTSHRRTGHQSGWRWWISVAAAGFARGERSGIGTPRHCHRRRLAPVCGGAGAARWRGRPTP